MKKLINILIVDNDKWCKEEFKPHLKKEGYNVISSENGNEAMMKFKVFKPEIVLLDVELPGKDGWEVCRKIRQESKASVIFITNRSEISDKLLGFELGADDYMVKPFDPREAVVRIKAVSRRAGINDSDHIEELYYDNININLSEYKLIINGENTEIPPKELELLYFMASHPNRVHTRNQLLDAVWGTDYYGDARTIDVHINRIREKLEGVSDRWKLKTVWGVGYKFESE